MFFKDSLIYISGGPFVQFTVMIYAILVEGIMRNFLWNYFEFGPLAQEMSLKDLSYIQL